ncbi:unnamed protein product [Fraxinus pennsylvanica]|uniref:C2 NT-type domain-containing protein n=1 Tax=Fraxinus pennsylvanica TaxID=56036 RepID=A0AAD2ABA3_9LAMI|nr:unnamed protein product [Fraxinus pennsylvanica]
MWMCKGDLLTTRPARVCEGIAEFEESLMHTCTVYGSRNGHKHSSKYEPKLSSLHVSVIGAPVHDIGKHWIDLSNLLSLTFEELDEDKRMLCVPNIVGERRPIVTEHLAGFDGTNGTNRLHMLGSVQRYSSRGSHRQSQSLDLQFLDQISPNQELLQSIILLHRTLDKGKMGNSVAFDFFHEDLESLTSKSGSSSESVMEVPEICLMIQSVLSVIEIIDVAEILEGHGVISDENAACNSKLEESGYNENKNAKDDGSSTDDEVSDSGPESPRDIILGQVETNTSAWRNSIFDIGIMAEQKSRCLAPPSGCSEDLIYYLLFKKAKGSMNSPCTSSGGFGSPVCIPAQEQLKLPSLEEGQVQLFGQRMVASYVQ